MLNLKSIRILCLKIRVPNSVEINCATPLSTHLYRFSHARTKLQQITFEFGHRTVRNTVVGWERLVIFFLVWFSMNALLEHMELLTMNFSCGASILPSLGLL